MSFSKNNEGEIVNNNSSDNLNRIEVAIRELKENGLKLSSVHYRNVTLPYSLNGSKKEIVLVPVPMPLHEIKRRGLQKNIISNGGYTTVRIKNKNGTIDVTGVAECSVEDGFNNRLGYIKGLHKAIGLLPEEYRPQSTLTDKE